MDAYDAQESSEVRVHQMLPHYHAVVAHCCIVGASRSGVHRCPAERCYPALDRYRSDADHTGDYYHGQVVPLVDAVRHSEAVRQPDDWFADDYHHADGHFVG